MNEASSEHKSFELLHIHSATCSVKNRVNKCLEVNDSNFEHLIWDTY